jgi:phage terminase large subunit-like protein
MRDQVRIAIDIPSQRSIIRRLNFCQWMQQATVWIPPEAWAACKGTASSASLVGRACYLGIDLSDKIDLSSVVAIFPREMDRGGMTVESDGKTTAVDRAIDVLPFFWMPKKTLQSRSQEDNIPYERWESEGHLFATNGSMIDHDAIVDYIIQVLAKTYQVQAIGVDQAGASAVITRLRRQFGESFVREIPQGFRRLSTPSKMIEALIMSGNLTHDGHPVLTWCMSNMAVEENSWREIRPIKIDQRKRIDGGVALIDAQAVMLEAPEVPVSMYEREGVLVV